MEVAPRTTMSTLFLDVRSGIRQDARHRAFSTLVILTLALGIGATTTFFSLLNALIFRPLPYADPDRLVSVRGLVDTGALAPSYESVARLPGSPFGAIAAYTSGDVNASAPDGAERVFG